MRQLEQRTYNNISGEDKALFRALYESYDSSDIDRYINELKLNEDHFAGVAHAQSYSQTTPGTTERGVKGLVKALPSAVISCLICPAGTLIALIGAVRERFEKRFTKSLFNLARWADFVGTPKEKKKELVEKVKREVAERTKYFMAKLANGEIIRVVACHEYEAKQMAIAIEEELIIPQEEKFTKLANPDPSYVKSESEKSNERDDANDKLWVITFDDGETQYWQADKDADKNDIIKEANKQRRFIAGGFAKKFKKITKKELKGVGSSYDKEYEPIKVSKVENIELIDDEAKVTKITEYNKENVEIYEGDRLSSKTNIQSNLIYYALKSDNIAIDEKKSVPIIYASLPTVSIEEMTNDVSRFFTDDSYYYKSTFVKNYQKYITEELSPSEDSSIYLGKFKFANNCTIMLLYGGKNNVYPTKLVIELNNKFRDFLKNNKNIDNNTKKRLDKYVFDQKSQNVVAAKPLIDKGFEYKGLNVNNNSIIANLLTKYKNAFERNVKLEAPDENGNKTESEINLAA